MALNRKEYMVLRKKYSPHAFSTYAEYKTPVSQYVCVTLAFLVLAGVGSLLVSLVLAVVVGGVLQMILPDSVSGSNRFLTAYLISLCIVVSVVVGLMWWWRSSNRRKLAKLETNKVTVTGEIVDKWVESQLDDDPIGCLAYRYDGHIGYQALEWSPLRKRLPEEFIEPFEPGMPIEITYVINDPIIHQISFDWFKQFQ